MSWYASGTAANTWLEYTVANFVTKQSQQLCIFMYVPRFTITACTCTFLPLKYPNIFMLVLLFHSPLLSFSLALSYQLRSALVVIVIITLFINSH